MGAPETPSFTPVATSEGDAVAAVPVRTSQTCMGCCDFRRAVVIVNIIAIVICLVFDLLLVLVIPEMKNNPDYPRAQYEMLHNAEGPMLIASIFSMTMYGLAILGALQFDRCKVCPAGVVYCLNCVAGLLQFNILGAILAGFFAWPHFALMNEIRLGVMNPETYPREAQCCCA